MAEKTKCRSRKLSLAKKQNCTYLLSTANVNSSDICVRNLQKPLHEGKNSFAHKFNITAQIVFLSFVMSFIKSTVGKWTFPVSGATVWNNLPLHVASATSLAVFRQRLKTFLCPRSYQDTII